MKTNRLMQAKCFWPALALFAVSTGSALAVPTLKWTAPTAPLTFGKTFAATIEVSDLGASGAPSIGAYHFTVRFDPARLALADLATGDILLGNQLAQQGASTRTSFKVTAPGVLDLLEVSLASPAGLDSDQVGQFTLVTLFFQVLSSGKSTLELSVRSLGDAEGRGLNHALAGEGKVEVSVPAGIASVRSDGICTDHDEGFSSVAAGDVEGILMLPGIRFAERFVGHSLKSLAGIDLLTGTPANPLFLVPGETGQNLICLAIARDRHELGGKSATGDFQGTIAALFDRNQSEFAITLSRLIENDILIDFYDRGGTRVDRFNATSRLGRLSLYFRRLGGAADIAGFTLQTGKDNPDQETNGQSILSVSFTLDSSNCQATFRRGDDNASGDMDISDPISSLDYQFLGTFEPPCKDAMDYDDNGEIEISDAIASLTFQFLGGTPPAAPGKDACGIDPTPDRADGGDLGCEVFPVFACTR